jgi:hypothetical protein
VRAQPQHLEKLERGGCPEATPVFHEIARLTKGAHLRFDEGSAKFRGSSSSGNGSGAASIFWPFDGWDIPVGRSTIAEV